MPPNPCSILADLSDSLLDRARRTLAPVVLTARDRLRDNADMTDSTDQPTTPLPVATAAPICLLDLSLDELTALIVDLDEPTFRARQIWDWIYQRYAGDFAQMTNLPKPLRAKLAAVAVIDPLTPITRIGSAAADTQKVLFQLADSQTIETVLMLYDKRRTLCISSQAGCAMGCTFCATALGGLARNLTPGEIVAQVLYFARYLAAADAVPPAPVERPTRVTNIVLMGMGEPLHNYDNVWTALRRLTDNDAFGLGARNITLSTVGLVPMIDRMADEDLQIGLAVSLHAPDDDVRGSLVPVNRRWHVDDILAAVRRYIAKTHRRVTFEYALMQGINDSPAQAHALGEKLAHLLCHVNVIPLNPIPDSPYQPSSRRGDGRVRRNLTRTRRAGHRAAAARD